MIATPTAAAVSVDSGLSRAVEPLANFICAADRPHEALRTALRTLLDEVQRTNSTANRYLSGQAGVC